MDLLFGTNVREYGQRAGRLAGFEVDAVSHRVRKVIFSGDGELGNHALARPFPAVLAEPSYLEVRPYTPTDEPEGETVLLGHSTRIVRAGREIGRLTGVDVVVGTGELNAIIGRKSWWSRRFTLVAGSLDLSVPGEIRTGAPTSRAA